MSFSKSGTPRFYDDRPKSLPKEINWGLKYRGVRNAENPPAALNPVRSPIDISYFMCRRREIKVKIEELNRSKSESKARQRPRPKTAPPKPIRHSFIERSILSHKQYIKVLSTPNLNPTTHFNLNLKPETPKLTCKTLTEICSPRLAQLAVPKKICVLSNWKLGEHVLPMEMISRLQEILHTNQNVEIKEARHYFKKCDRKKCKLRKKRQRQKRKRERAKALLWLKCESKHTAKLMMNHLKDEPQASLNYKQLLISEILLNYLGHGLNRKKPINRNSFKYFDRSLIEVTDKIAVWADTMLKLTEVQAVDDEVSEESEEDLEKEMEAQAGEGEEGEGEEEREGEEVVQEEKEEELPLITGEQKSEETIISEAGTAVVIDMGEEGMLAGEFDLAGVSSLQRLIQILANCSSAYLNKPIGEADYGENVTHKVLLEKLKILDSGSGAQTATEYLEKVMIEWALHNEPNSVDEQLLQKIHDTAQIITAMLASEGPGGMVATFAAEIGDMGEGEEGTDQEGGAEAGEEGEGEVEPVVGEEEIIRALEEGEGEEVEGGGEGEEGEDDEGEGDEGEGGEEGEEGEEGPALQYTESGTLIPPAEGEGERFDGKESVPLIPEGVEVEYLNGIPVAKIVDADGNEMYVTYDSKGNAIPIVLDENGNPLVSATGKPLRVPLGADGKPVAVEYINGMPISTIIDESGNEVKITYGPNGKPIPVHFDANGDPIPFDISKDGLAVVTIFDEDGNPISIAYDNQGRAIKGHLTESGTFIPAEGALESPTGSRESMVTVIKGHQPEVTEEHSPNTVCCLTLKIWAVWLLEITHNAHNWTKWISNIIAQIREFAAILRGEVRLPNGQKKVLYKEDWNRFIAEMDENVIAWRQYSRHVNDLTTKIVEKFHEKRVSCCPKCLEDQLIKNVVTAHETMRSLTEALNCAGYWQRCLDEIVQATTKLSDVALEPLIQEDDSVTGWSYETVDSATCTCEKPTRKVPSKPKLCPCALKQIWPEPAKPCTSSRSTSTKPTRSKVCQGCRNTRR